MGTDRPDVYWQDNSTLLCFLGGIIIGLVAATRMATRGKVTGISGFFQTTVKMTLENFKEKIISCLFVVGLVLGGAIGRTYLPEAYEDWSDLPLARLIIAGLLVGYGTVTGNGCTSGHGVCGIASLRVRSFVATGVFFLSAIVTAMASNTSSYLPFFINKLDVADASYTFLVFVGVTLIATGLAKLVSHLEHHHHLVALIRGITECLYGMCFAIALIISNMTKLSATISFLDLRYWNPALAFVMMIAIPVAYFGFYIAKLLDAPFLEKDFSNVSFRSIDYRLVFGAMLFGIGWGLAGACPGPAITNLGSGNTPPIIYCASIAVGMWLQHLSDPYLPVILKSGGRILFHIESTSKPNPSYSSSPPNNNNNNTSNISIQLEQGGEIQKSPIAPPSPMKSNSNRNAVSPDEVRKDFDEENTNNTVELFTK